MKTYIPKPKHIQKKWYLLDARDKILGRLATEIAILLRGKQKAIFTPHLDCGDYVVVINACKIKVSGSKQDKKIYFRHSGYPGGIKSQTFKELFQKDPCKIIQKAVWGMLPHNKLGRQIIKKLKVYPGSEYPRKEQKLEKYEI
jgi:large subunit ribosomal protein L13